MTFIYMSYVIFCEKIKNFYCFILQARFNREFRKLYSCLPCIDASTIDGELIDNRKNIPLLTQAQLRRIKCQKYSPNSSRQQRSRQNTTASVNSIQLNSQSSSISITNNSSAKRQQGIFSNRIQSRLLIDNDRNCYSPKPNGTASNCEKFLLD